MFVISTWVSLNRWGTSIVLNVSRWGRRFIYARLRAPIISIKNGLFIMNGNAQTTMNLAILSVRIPDLFSSPLADKYSSYFYLLIGSFSMLPYKSVVWSWLREILGDTWGLESLNWLHSFICSSAIKWSNSESIHFVLCDCATTMLVSL